LINFEELYELLQENSTKINKTTTNGWQRFAEIAEILQD
jgi:hypothetical protein